MQTKFLIANWKSNKTQASTKAWLADFLTKLKSLKLNQNTQIVICPPFPLLSSVANWLQKNSDHPWIEQIALGVQDLSSFPAGSYTGAISVQNLGNLKIKYAIVGHSERRRYFHETHQDIAKKVEQALGAEITPILCVDKDYIEDQAQALAADQLSQCVVAYEPLAAIGSGKNEDVGTVKKMVAQIREIFGQVPVVYGGSTNEENVNEYLLVSQGVLVGGASLRVEQFAEMVKRVSWPVGTRKQQN